ncbi:hypothetical protein GC176_04950 [bacterium]|nr:hypothetical protein [bacterium]
MSASSEQRSLFGRFLEVFFQEQSIKWMLGVGIMILLGSSLMLVTSHWDTCTPLWKSLILLGYTAGIHVAGQISFHSLGLRKTGTGLMALTVLLIPLSFHVLRWIHVDGFLTHATALAVMVANSVFAFLAAGRVFRHLLRSSQPTFLVSYCTLCLAAAVLPAVSTTAAVWVALLLWAVFAIGAIKVNRHVFWLTEEYRLPRIYGFFPILLLCGQYLTLFASSLASRISYEWIGFGCVLTAIPVLLAVDSLTRVFLQAHGQLERPLPWSIVLPIFLGLALTATGLCLSALNFPHGVALVPTATLAALLLGIVAHRTQNRAFVWAMLAAVLVAYQSSPVFFRDLARQLVEHSATAVHEARLPIAFYGLTYFPLLAGLTVLAKQLARRDRALFAAPLMHFAIGLGTLLLTVSLTHAKAIFPVSLASVALFALHASLFRSRTAIGLGVAAWCGAALSCTTFLTTVLLVAPHSELPLLPLTVASGLLLFPGSLIDRHVARWLPVKQREGATQLCSLTSLLTLMAIAGGWLISAFLHLPEVAPLSGGLIVVSLFAHAIVQRRKLVPELALSFASVASGVLALVAGWSLTAIITLVTAIQTLLWLSGPWLRGPVLGVFAEPARRISFAAMLLITTGVLLPNWLSTLAMGISFELWFPAVAAVLWAFDASRRFEAQWLIVLGWSGLQTTVGAASVELFGREAVFAWLPAVWSGVSLLTVLTARSPRLLSESTRITLMSSALSILALTATASLLVFSTPIRVAGGIALTGLLILAAVRRQTTMRALALMLVNWQLLCVLIQCCCPTLNSLLDVTLTAFAPVAIPVALAATILALGWQKTLWRGCHEITELIVVHRMLLKCVASAALLAALFSLETELTGLEAAFAAATFLTLAADAVLSALRLSNGSSIELPTGNGAFIPVEQPSLANKAVRDSKNSLSATEHVWLTEAIITLGVSYLALCGVISFGSGLSMFAVLGTGFAAAVIAHVAERSPRTQVLSGPLALAGHCLPALTVVIGLGRHIAGSVSIWLGMNSFALLLAAAFYFWRGLERKSSGLLVGSAVILNVAFALLWNELSWTDPQFFMIPLGISLLGLVELLRNELPAKTLNPLRYVGALVILVSPTFHIVGGSWLHLFTLMVAAVGITLLAMGLRIRALMYTGTAFLAADLIAMVVRGSIDNPSILWIAGISLGLLVIGLAAWCERHRELLQQRVRLLAAELETWN